MRRFHKIMIIFALCVILTLAKKKKKTNIDSENNPFGSDHDIIINPNLAEFEDEIVKSNNLVFLYVFDSKQERSS